MTAPDVAGWLTRLEETHKAATPGPWDLGPNWTGGWAIARASIEDPDGAPVFHPSGWTEADAAAIVAAHNATPALIAAMRAVLELADDLYGMGERIGTATAADLIRSAVAAALDGAA